MSSGDFFDFAVDLARSHSALLVGDSPSRVAPPHREPAPKAFEELDIREQLDAADTICRRQVYAEARDEALPNSDRYESWLKKLLDYSASDAEIVREARKIVLAHLQASAHERGEDLADFL